MRVVIKKADGYFLPARYTGIMRIRIGYIFLKNHQKQNFMLVLNRYVYQASINNDKPRLIK